MDDGGGRKIINLDSNNSELIFPYPNNLDILEKINFQFKEELTLSFEFNSLKKQVQFKKIYNLIYKIRNKNE